MYKLVIGHFLILYVYVWQYNFLTTTIKIVYKALL